MTLRSFIKKTFTYRADTSREALPLSASAVARRSVKLENLELSHPRTTAEIKQAYQEGRFAEMTAKQAGG